MNTREIMGTMAQKYGRPQLNRAVLVMPRVCAVHAMPWTAVYERLPNGLFQLLECVSSPANVVGTSTSIAEVPADIVRGSVEEVCAICGAKSLGGEWAAGVVKCRGCKQFVCLGRSMVTQNGLLFRCYCPSSGVVERRLRGYEGVLLGGSGPPLRRPTEPLLLPFRSTLRLTNGGR
jgi:hypothetical protein